MHLNCIDPTAERFSPEGEHLLQEDNLIGFTMEREKPVNEYLMNYMRTFSYNDHIIQKRNKTLRGFNVQEMVR
jgi:hypothetical protein